jgi:hypothetical protein
MMKVISAQGAPNYAREEIYTMEGSLNEILPEPISKKNEEAVLNFVKRKMMVSLDLAVEILHAMEKRFGSEAREVIREMAIQQEFDIREKTGSPEKDLQDFCNMAEHMAAGTHRWKRVIDTTTAIGYEFTRCMYAEILRELGEPELGLIICARDEPWVKSYNPKLGFRSTKKLMDGDEICDNVYLVEK